MVDVKTRAEQVIRLLMADDGSGWLTSRGLLFNHTIFGRDVSMMSLWMLEAGDEFRAPARATIHTLSKYQGLARHPLNEEQPGRILNEYKPYAKWHAGRAIKAANRAIGLVWGGTWTSELGYIGLDTTPLYVQLVCQYAATDRTVLDERVTRRDGNTVLVRQCLLEAVDWIMAHRRYHGLVATRRHNPFSLFFQSWRDSHLAYLYPNGKLASLSRPVAYLEVQILAVDALRAAADLLGHDLPAEAMTWSTAADALVASIIDQFWLEKEQMFAMALDISRTGHVIAMPTPASSQGWMLDSTVFDGLSHAERRRYIEPIVRRLSSSEFMTATGIRARGNGADAGLGLADYHGSWTVWPMDTYKFARGLRRQGLPKFAADLESRILGAVTAAGSFYEFFLVSPAGEVLWKPHQKPVSKPARQINLQILPERDLGWTTTACYLLTHDIFVPRAPRTTEPWRYTLDQEITTHLNHKPPHQQSSQHPFGVHTWRGAWQVVTKATVALAREYVLKR